MYEAIIQEPAKRFIRQLLKEKQGRIIERIHLFEKKPYSGYVLKGKLAGLRSSRIDEFRIIYQIREIELIIFVLKVDTKDKAYKEKPKP